MTGERLRGTAALLFLTLFLASCGSEPAPPKVLVIGLDGATYRLLDPWMAAGELPRLRELRETGVSGTLVSTIPALSPPAWTTAVTGVNPGTHGIFDFFRLDPDSMIAYTESAQSRRVPAIWTLLSESHARVGVLNVPMSDPPDPVHGFHVAGLPHADTVGYAYPPELETALHRQGYLTDRMGGLLEPGREQVLLDEIMDTFRARRRAALELARENPDLDLYWVVFTGTDRIQHFFWKFMEKEHPFHDPELAAQYGDAILELWRETDAAVGELVDLARSQAEAEGRELAVLVISDHGFTGVHRVFRPQSFFRNPPDGFEPITDSYSLETNASMIYLPVEGREPTAGRSAADQKAVLTSMRDRVLAVRDPESGRSPVTFGALGRSVYSGRYAAKAPDLVFVPRPPYYLIHEEGDKTPFGTPELAFSGHHDMQGILIAQGPMFGSGVLEGNQGLIDIAPTVVYLAGRPVPGYMEGEVLLPLLRPEFVDAHPVRRDGSEAQETGTDVPPPHKMIPYLGQ